MGFLRREFPHMVDGYNRLYPRAYVPSAYATAVRSTIDALQKKYEVNRRASRVPATASSSADDRPNTGQAAFNWSEAEPNAGRDL
jgi:hypothetical protein